MLKIMAACHSGAPFQPGALRTCVPCLMVNPALVTHNLSQLLQSVQIELLNVGREARWLTSMTSPQCCRGSVKAPSTSSLTSGSNRVLWPVCRTLNLCSLVSPAAAGSATVLNVRAASPEEYYRCAVFIPFMDHVLSDLQERFADHNRRAVYCLSTILPAFVNQ